MQYAEFWATHVAIEDKCVEILRALNGWAPTVTKITFYEDSVGIDGVGLSGSVFKFEVRSWMFDVQIDQLVAFVNNCKAIDGEDRSARPKSLWVSMYYDSVEDTTEIIKYYWDINVAIDETTKYVSGILGPHGIAGRYWLLGRDDAQLETDWGKYRIKRVVVE